MRKGWILLAIMALAVGGCGVETEIADTHTVVPTDPPPVTSPIPVILEPTPIPALPAGSQLDPRNTFEVIAAVHAYVLMVEEWAAQDLSPFERQAIVHPLLEIGLGPLGEIYAGRIPEPRLAAVWELSEGVYADFAPLALDWAGGTLTDDDFPDVFAEIKIRSRQMIEEGVLIASALGVETARYGPGYADAAVAVFGLVPIPARTDVAGAPAALDARLEINGDLLAVEVQPYLYPFAGSDVFLVVGRVENAGSAPLAGVEVEVTFYNFLNEDLGTVRGRLLAEVANPGAVYPFSASTVTEGEEAALKDWIRYEAVGYARLVDEASYQSFELVLSETTVNASGEVHLAGELTNLGDQTVSAADIRVGVMAFDSAGQLVGVGDGFVSQETLVMPGDTVRFQAVLDAVSGEPVEFRFFAEAVEK